MHLPAKQQVLPALACKAEATSCPCLQSLGYFLPLPAKQKGLPALAFKAKVASFRCLKAEATS